MFKIYKTRLGDNTLQLSASALFEEIIPVWGRKGQNSGCFCYVGNIDVTKAYAEDTMMTLHQDISTPVPTGDFMDGYMSRLYLKMY